MPRPGQTILDIGSGTGHYTVELARRGALAIAIEIAPWFIEEASRGLCQVKLARACAADASRLPFRNETVDSILLSGTIQNVEEEPILRECVRVLRPGGRIVLTALEKGPSAEAFYSKSESGVRALLVRLFRLPPTARSFSEAFRRTRGIDKYVDRCRITSCLESLGLRQEETSFLPSGLASRVVDVFDLLTWRRRTSWSQTKIGFALGYPPLSLIQALDGRNAPGSEWIAGFRRPAQANEEAREP